MFENRPGPGRGDYRPGLANRLVRLEVRADGEDAVVELEGSEAPTFTTTSGEGRLVIDFPAATLAGVPAETPGAGPVRSVRAVPFGAMVRVAVELVAGAEADIEVRGHRLVVTVARHLPVALVAPGASLRIEADRAARAEEERARFEREEAERIARIEEEKRAREEAARLAKLEAEKKAREEAARLAKLEAEKKAREEAARLAKLEAEREAREQAERLARLEVEGPVAAEKGGPQEVVHVGFRPRAGGAQVVIRTAAAPRFELAERSGGVMLVFPRAQIPMANHRRAIDASFFGTRVGMVTPVVDHRTGEVRIEIDVLGRPGVQLLTDGAEVVLDFEGLL